MKPFEISWMNPNVLYVQYHGPQTAQTIKQCLDEEAIFLDSVLVPIVVIVDWLAVDVVEKGALTAHINHRTYTHPMGKFVLLVGFGRPEAFMNDLTIQWSHKTQHTSKNNRYVDTMVEALALLRDLVE